MNGGGRIDTPPYGHGWQVPEKLIPVTSPSYFVESILLYIIA